jgi:peptidoglycan/LPS O-acetylase OafA/YrhL
MVALAGTGTRERKRLPVLDGIRGVCAIGVVFTHVAFATFVTSTIVGPQHHSIWAILAAGQLSIGPFFILSGLLLYRPFARRTLAGTPWPDLKVFFLRRAARILPAFWLVAVADLLLLNLTAIHGIWDVLRPLTLMHIYNFHYYAGMDVLWTVPTEAQFYLALPVLAVVMHLLARNVADPVKKARRMLIPVAVMIAVEFAWTAYVHSHYPNFVPQYFYPMSITGLFGIGMALAVWSVRSEVVPDRKPGIFRLAAAHPNWFWIAAIAFYALNCAQPWGHAGAANWQTAPAALVRDVCLQAFSGLIMLPLVMPGSSSRFMNVTLGNRPIRYIGRISYGIYLWHFTMIYLRFKSGSVYGKIIPVNLLLGKYGFWDSVIPVLAGAIAVASLSFFILERPLIRRTERLIKVPVPQGDPQMTPAVGRPIA